MMNKNRSLALLICLSVSALYGMHSEKGKEVMQVESSKTSDYHGNVPLSLSKDDRENFPGLKVNQLSAPITSEQTSVILQWLKVKGINKVNKEAPIIIHHDCICFSLYAFENIQPYMKTLQTEKRKQFLQQGGLLAMGRIKDGVFEDLSEGIKKVGVFVSE